MLAEPGIGVIVRAIWEVDKMVVRDAVHHQESMMNWPNLAGVKSGVAILYLTAILVKF